MANALLLCIDSTNKACYCSYVYAMHLVCQKAWMVTLDGMGGFESLNVHDTVVRKVVLAQMHAVGLV